MITLQIPVSPSVAVQGSRAWRVVALAATLLLSVSGFALGTASSASALTTSCSGKLLRSKPLVVDGSTTSYGTLSLYYDSASGTNCAKATKRNTSEKQEFSVWVFRCTRPNATTPQACDATERAVQGKNLDSGPYFSYAGAVHTLGSSAGRCVYAGAELELQRAALYARAEIVGYCD